MYLANGNYISIEKLNTLPSFNKEEAKQIFAKYKGIPINEIESFIADLIIKEILDNSQISSISNPVLVYQVTFITGHANNTEIGYIDAHSGNVLYTEPSIINSSAYGTFETRYNGTRQAHTEYDSDYILHDLSWQGEIHTMDLDGSTNINDTDELEDSDNYWSADEYHSNKDDMALDIHWALQKIYEYFDDEYSIGSFDNNDHDVDAYFDYGNTNTLRDNSGWHPTLHHLVFGEGAVKYDAVASLDAVAHEYGHGISTFQIGWASTGDPAAFQEGLSDIWAVILENRISPKSIWKIGEEISLNYDCIRNIQDPDNPYAERQIADTYLSDLYNDDSDPSLVPYIKGGVFSHWFYLLVNGGTGTNENDDDYAVYGIGMDAAEELIVETVFNGYLEYTTTFSGIRTQFIEAAEDEVFAENSFQALQVANAWYAVGIGSNPGQVTLSGSNVICNAGTVITANNSPNGSTISWITSNNLEVYSGGNTSAPTFKPKYTTSLGDGWVQVRYTTSGVTTNGPKMYVGVNQPYSYDLNIDLYTSGGTPVSYMCPNTYYHIYLSNDRYCSLSNYSWSIPAAWDSMYQYNNMISVYTNATPGGMVEVYANTCCGVNRKVIIDYLASGYCGGYYSMGFTPNPTTGEKT